MEKEKVDIWATQVLIPFSLTSMTHVFLVLFPKSPAKPDRLKKISLFIAATNLGHLKTQSMS